jgi:hypothetical protein
MHYGQNRVARAVREHPRAWPTPQEVPTWPTVVALYSDHRLSGRS